MHKLFAFIGGALLAASAVAQQALPEGPGLQVKEATFFQLEKIGVHVASQHFPYSGENNFNPGMYVGFRAGSIGGLVVGDYLNSINRNSFYIGKNFKLYEHGRFEAGIMVAAITGYPTDSYIDKAGTRHLIFGKPVLPLGALTMAYEVQPHSYVRVTIVPRIHKFNETTAVHLSVERSF